MPRKMSLEKVNLKSLQAAPRKSLPKKKPTPPGLWGGKKPHSERPMVPLRTRQKFTRVTPCAVKGYACYRKALRGNDLRRGQRDRCRTLVGRGEAERLQAV